MKKLTITISDQAHGELLKIQLDKRLKENKKTSLADVAAEVLQKTLVEKENPTE